jgi:hypothetical protein
MVSKVFWPDGIFAPRGLPVGKNRFARSESMSASSPPSLSTLERASGQYPIPKT